MTQDEKTQDNGSEAGFQPTLPNLEVGSVIKHLEWLRLSHLRDITGAEATGITHTVGNWEIREEFQVLIDETTNALAILDGYPYIARQALEAVGREVSE